MSDKELSEYNNISSMPDRLKFELLQKLDPSKNPNVTPVTGREHVYLNGILQEDGGEHYTISGTTITFGTALVSGDILRVSYRK